MYLTGIFLDFQCLMLFSFNKDKGAEADLPGIRPRRNNPPVGPSSCGEAYSITKPDIKID